MTDQHNSPNLLLVMDCLWFNQAILSSEPTPPPPSSPPLSISQTSLDSASDFFSTAAPTEEEHSDSSDASPASPKDDYTTEASDEGETEYRYQRIRPIADANRSRRRSSSPKLPKNLRNSETSLMKTTSCKSLFELEYEEVKGFMDLGFEFKKDKLCPRMMSVLPGLQRLDECIKEEQKIKEEIVDDGKEKAVERPYLSEAWLIRRPDSPLLNMRIPRVSTSSPKDMKKHLKCWARNVATSIQLEY